MIYDQLIIGCGVAGLNELKKALQEKKNVCVVARNFGATQHLTGAFDSGLSQDFFDFYGVPGVSGASVLTVGPVGQVRPVGGAFKTQHLTQSELEKTKKALFVAIEGLPDFPASLIVPNLKKSFSNIVPVQFSGIDLNITSPHAHVLHLFDEGHAFDAFKFFLEQNKRDSDLVVIPPILGMKNFISLHEKLEKSLGVRIIEQLSTTPPVAGSRFTEIIKKFFVEKKVAVVWEEVVGFEEEGDRVTGVVVNVSSSVVCRPSSEDSRNTEYGQCATIQAKEFVLATGKFIGGGLVFEDGVKESVFDLPCSVGAGLVSKNVPITNLITRNPKQEQGFSKLGVLVDQQQRVIDPISKQPIFENLKAVGHVCAG